MSTDSAEFAREVEECEQARNRDIMAIRAELTAALRGISEQLDHAQRLCWTLGEGQLYDVEYVDSMAGPDAERWIADAARDIRAAHHIITSLP